MSSTTHKPTQSSSSMSSNGIPDQAREAASHAAAGAMELGKEAAKHYVEEPTKDLLSLAKAYAKDHPDVAACWAFGLGVVIGWKLKP